MSWGDEAVEPEEIRAVCKGRETEDSVSFRLQALGWVWFPKSVLIDQDKLGDGTHVLTVAAWFAHSKSLV